MTTILTEIGWVDENGTLIGTWTNRPDEVDEGDEITVASDVTANSLGGGDTISGGASGGSFGILNEGRIDTETGDDTILGSSGMGLVNLGRFGILNEGTIFTGAGNDTISGNASFSDSGILNEGTIFTETGDDTISGIVGESGGPCILNEGAIITGAGSDTISGNATDSSFLVNEGRIDTGTGDDTISGDALDASFGILNEGRIDTGTGDDTILGETIDGDSGILNDGTINTGAGKDTVDALTGGFGGTGTIDLGVGRDLIRGFGEQIVDGGRGCDTAELGIDFDSDLLSLGCSFDIKIGEMEFINVEQFLFTGGKTFSLEQLQGEVIV